MNRLICQGAESKIFLIQNPDEYNNKPFIRKLRISKSYRNEILDNSLRKSRTKKEAKLLNKVLEVSPKVLSTNDLDTIDMEFIDGPQLKQVLDTNPKLALFAGKIVAFLHSKGIIHGDLTTSNFILESNNNLKVIDFGLCSYSHKFEDMAVDLHLFRESLESVHFRVEELAWDYFLEGYNFESKKSVLERLKNVELRGRYKGKGD